MNAVLSIEESDVSVSTPVVLLFEEEYEPARPMRRRAAGLTRATGLSRQSAPRMDEEDDDFEEDEAEDDDEEWEDDDDELDEEEEEVGDEDEELEDEDEDDEDDDWEDDEDEDWEDDDEEEEGPE